jgi:hypothetical protein
VRTESGAVSADVRRGLRGRRRQEVPCRPQGQRNQLQFSQCEVLTPAARYEPAVDGHRCDRSVRAAVTGRLP